MARRIRSRGPDDEGVWVDAREALALAHRRLSILDLSPAGHQPMCSPCGRYVLVYNGEIYNHTELRTDLEAVGGHFDWRGHSDTESLLAALRHWGVKEALTRVNGMFAFALWDARDRCLVLARDRMGEKPLYYGRSGDTFLFGSELKALAAHPNWRAEVNRDALAMYMRFKQVPAPWSIFDGIAKLPPGHYVAIRDGGRAVGEPQCYWDLASVAEKGIGTVPSDPQTLTDALDELLKDAVRQRMAADVPLGAFLSGGYDSTTIVALMQAQSSRPVRTFSIGFHEKAYDEAAHARTVAAHLGTDHTELYVSANDAMAVVPNLPIIYDEPFGGSSQIPTFLVSELARRYVTVSLSGDGGDELFAGYNRHVLGSAIWQRTSWLPYGFRRAMGGVLQRVAQSKARHPDRWLPGAANVPHLGQKLEKVASAFEADSARAFYKDLASVWKTPNDIVIGACEPPCLADRFENGPALPGLCEEMTYLDMMTYLPDEVLTKVDRATMAVGLEARVPLLDHRVVEFSWKVPIQYKVRNGKGKWLLRELLSRYVSRDLVDRPKKGFGVPIEHWLRGPLRDWAEELLRPERLQDEGFLNPKPICDVWREHVSGRRSWHHHIWVALMFQAWLEKSRQQNTGQ